MFININVTNLEKNKCFFINALISKIHLHLIKIQCTMFLVYNCFVKIWAISKENQMKSFLITCATYDCKEDQFQTPWPILQQ